MSSLLLKLPARIYLYPGSLLKEGPECEPAPVWQPIRPVQKAAAAIANTIALQAVTVHEVLSPNACRSPLGDRHAHFDGPVHLAITDMI